MVFQNKGGIGAKQQTPAKQNGKRPATSSVDNSVMKKTPQGKQIEVDRRASFQMLGKNTPSGKAAKNENSFGKKQLTPGRPTALKGFKGTLAQNSAKNKSQKEQDSDDEEAEDDEDADLNMLLGGDDDDEMENDDEDDGEEEDDDEEEEEDDDEEEEDEDDEDKDEEEEGQQKMQPKKKGNVQQNRVNAQKKGASFAESNTLQKSPNKEMQTPEKKELQIGCEKALELTEHQKRARDAKTLFIGSLPQDVKQAELQALSTDIISVNIPYKSRTSKSKFSFAFLGFNDESKAEENYKLLKGMKLRGQEFKIDFTGSKSQNQNREQKQNVQQAVDMRKLLVSNLSQDVTIYKIAKFFPKAFQISLSACQLNRTALVHFNSEKFAAEAVEATSSAEIDGRPFTVVYEKRVPKFSHKREWSGWNAQQNKKMKFSNKRSG